MQAGGVSVAGRSAEVVPGAIGRGRTPRVDGDLGLVPAAPYRWQLQKLRAHLSLQEGWPCPALHPLAAVFGGKEICRNRTNENVGEREKPRARNDRKSGRTPEQRLVSCVALLHATEAGRRRATAALEAPGLRNRDGLLASAVHRGSPDRLDGAPFHLRRSAC